MRFRSGAQQEGLLWLLGRRHEEVFICSAPVGSPLSRNNVGVKMETSQYSSSPKLARQLDCCDLKSEILHIHLKTLQGMLAAKRVLRFLTFSPQELPWLPCFAALCCC